MERRRAAFVLLGMLYLAVGTLDVVQAGKSLLFSRRATDSLARSLARGMDRLLVASRARALRTNLPSVDSHRIGRSHSSAGSGETPITTRSRFDQKWKRMEMIGRDRPFFRPFSFSDRGPRPLETG